MESVQKYMRYAHSEGHTDLCFDEEGRYILTCGTDGDIRIWDGPEDDDPVSHRVGERAFSIVKKKERFYVGADTNSVQAYTFPEGDQDGIVTRFTGHVTDMCCSDDGTVLIAGSSDFTIKIVQTVDSSCRTLEGHNAPILSVALDPQKEFIASSSCDGTIKIWTLLKHSCIKTLNLIGKTNDFSASKTLCKLSWEPINAKFLAVPVEKEIHIYERSSWDLAFTLKDNRIKEVISLCTFSKCGTFLAGACTDGSIFVWNFLERKCISWQKHEKDIKICALEWNPKQKGVLAFCDVQGQLGVLKNIIPEDEEFLTEDEILAAVQDDFGMDNSDDENTFSISKIKAETVGLSETEDNAVLPAKTSQSKPLIDDDDSLGALDKIKDEASSEIISRPSTPSLTVAKPAAHFQEPFQPGSTPVHLRHRFMVWNSVGIIRCYNTEEENTIDIEFHDTTVHHALHVTNTLNHTMATMSTEAVLMASEIQSDCVSKLVCMHFNSWDNSNEWVMDMPEGEEIQAIALGQNWAAAATDKRNLRLFTLGGVQLNILSIPGPVVSMAGCIEYLSVVYHLAPGFPGEQCLGIMIMNVSQNKFLLPPGSPLPLSAKSYLSWIGFSDEGTPVFSDSNGIIRLLNQKFKHIWSPILNTKSHTKGKSDHFFVLGISEIQQHLRCISCKGTRYPATLPRPVVMVLPLQFPLCEIHTEKGQLEETFWRHKMTTELFGRLDKEGFEVDTASKEEAEKIEKETLMKLFALACRVDREFRATEICELMPSSHSVQLAIKYASALKRLHLAQRLGEMAHQKEEAELQKFRSHVEEEETLVVNHVTSSQISESNGFSTKRNSSNNNSMETDKDLFEDDMESEIMTEENMIDDYEENMIEQQTERLLSKIKSISSQPKFSLSSERKNPFKSGAGRLNSEPSKGITLFDHLPKAARGQKRSWDKLDKKEADSAFNPKSKVSKQALLHPGKKKSVSPKASVPVKPQKSAFQLWFDEMKDSLKEESPDANDTELLKMGMIRFKELDNEEKEMWTEKSKNNCPEDQPEKKKKKKVEEKQTLKKNPVDVDEKKQMPKKCSSDIEKTKSAVKKKPLLSGATNKKLMNFAFGKKDD